MSTPITLNKSAEHDDIVDAIYRVVLGLDTNDYDVFASAFTMDAKFNLNGNIMDGLGQIKANCYDGISKIDTTHFLSNTRVNMTKENTEASISASALAYHWRPQEGLASDTAPFKSGALYSFNLVKDTKDGLWKIRYWGLKLVWTEGDWSIVSGK